jgi:hypothetical protein
MKFDICVFFENLPGKFKFNSYRKIKTSTSHEDQCTFFILSRSFVLTVRNFSNRVADKIKTHGYVKQLFFLSKIMPFWR